jgi:hypothetical protein
MATTTTIYTVDSTDGTTTLVIQPRTVNGSGGVLRSTDLTLYGNATVNWGERFNENFYRLIENFACEESTPGVPQNETETGNGDGTGINVPLEGQTWYNKTDQHLYINTASVIPNWEQMPNTAEVQAWISSGVGAILPIDISDVTNLQTELDNLDNDKVNRAGDTNLTGVHSWGSIIINEGNGNENTAPDVRFNASGFISSGNHLYLGVDDQTSGTPGTGDLYVVKGSSSASSATLLFQIGNNGLVAEGIDSTTYASLVTAGNDQTIPNRKWVNDTISSSVGGLPYVSVSGDTMTGRLVINNALTGLVVGDVPTSYFNDYMIWSNQPGASYKNLIKLTHTALGETTNDGLDVGIRNDGAGIFNLRENSDIYFYTNNTEILSITNDAKLLFSDDVRITSNGSNIGIGDDAVDYTTNSSFNNVFIGDANRTNINLASNNVAVGRLALNNLTGGTGLSGDENVAVGAYSLQSNTVGYRNVAVGELSMSANVDGNFNTTLGYGSLSDASSSDYCVALGYHAQHESQGIRNISIGALSLDDANFTNDNVSIGHSALTRLTLGSGRNSTLGAYSGQYITSGNNNTVLGYNAGPSSGSGAIVNSTALGANAVVNTSNTIMLGNSAITNLLCYDTTISSPSDERDKYDIEPLPSMLGLSFINELKPVNFKYDFRDDYFTEVETEDGTEVQMVPEPHDGRHKREVERIGLIAQDVKSTIETLNVTFHGLRDISPEGETDEKYALNYMEFVTPLIKAVQELSSKIDDIDQRLIVLENNNS